MAEPATHAPTRRLRFEAQQLNRSSLQLRSLSEALLQRSNRLLALSDEIRSRIVPARRRA